MVDIQGLTHAFGERVVLSAIDLQIGKGEIVAIMGTSGGGKTTLVNLLPRFYDVDGGRVFLDGVDVRDVKLVELRRAVGIVFEETFLFHDTVAPHLAAYDPKASEAQQRDFLTLLHATLNAPNHPIRNRLLRLTADSPDLLAIIKAEGKV